MGSEPAAVWRLFERYPRPALIVGASVIERVNRAAESALGWLERDVRGRARDDLVRLDEASGGGAQDGAQDGEAAVERFRARVRTSSGHWMPYQVELRAFGDAWTLVELVRPLSPDTASPLASLPPPPADVLRFEIDTSAEGFGTVCHCAPDTPLDVGIKCYEVLFLRDTPCERCPAEKASLFGSSIAIHDGTGCYYVERCRRASPMVVSVEVKAIEEGLARELVHARLSTLARRAGLSAREHDVFELLVLGRSLGEIGTVLAISERTVRFHQGNLLGKLGAESRIDLLRLLL